ncbi:KTSC domain-containing protein [Brevundimonas sp.]|uniref:KTSC domain-containing protein n=1 Tax=Brevundimonas sp. TaxID=1871086 RepID=UPI003569C38E
MARCPVMPSTVIRRFSYDEPRRRLRVTFVSGDVYDYVGVPPEVEAAFRAAFSKGRFFASDIRDRYPFERVLIATP